MVVQLRKCCCCCGWNVRTCTIVIGVLSLVYSSGLFLYALVQTVLQGIIFSPVLRNDHGHSDLKTIATWVIAMTILILIFSLVKVILDSVLLVGASKMRPGMVKPWIVFGVLEVALVALGLIGFDIWLYNISEGRCGIACYAHIFPACIYFPLRIYFIIVVNSFHTQLMTNFANNIPMASMNEYEETDYHRVKNHDNFV